MIPQSQPTRSATSQVQLIVIISITLFAFSGLMVGFTVGALAHTKPTSNNTNLPQVNNNHTAPTPTASGFRTIPGSTCRA